MSLYDLLTLGVRVPTLLISNNGYEDIYDLRKVPHHEVIDFIDDLVKHVGHDFGYYYDMYVKHGKIWL